MLSREDRILSELIVSSGLATPESVELGAHGLDDANAAGLVESLVSQGKLDAATGRKLREEARAIDDLLSPELPEGRTLGEFRLLREIGRGGMGIVYEAEQASLRRRVALKVLPAGAALDERLAIRFLREARTVARLHHPGIVPVFGTGHEQGVLFYAMELVEGESLAERIDRGPLPAREAAEIAVGIADALQHAHDAGLVHRDVKPENVMLGADGRARLTDFGLVHDLQGTRLTRSHYVLGTPNYSAPEQVRGGSVDPKSDVYGAGAVLYAMLSGRPPFLGEVPAAVLGRLINEAPPSLDDVAQGAPPALIAICDRAMARDPALRFPTAGAFASALRGYLDESDDAGAMNEDTAAGGNGVRRRRALWVIVGAVMVVALVAAIRWLMLPPADPFRGRDVTTPASPVGLLQGTFRLFSTAPGAKPDIALSPDGEMLAYTSLTGFPTGRIFIERDGDPTAHRLVPNDTPQQAPAWSPDGTRVAYCSDGRLEIAEVAAGAIDATGMTCRGTKSWSPDGRRLVYGDRDWPLTRLSVVDIAARTAHVITGPGTDQPSWGPDGRIAGLGLRDGQYDIWTFREDGSDPRRVTDDSAREMSPVWSSVPGRLYYGSNRDESFDLWRVDLDVRTGAVMSGPAQVTHGWLGHPATLSAARNRERLAFVHDVGVARFWALTLDRRFAPTGAPQRLRIDLPFDAGLPQRAPGRDEWIAVVRRGDAENLQRFGPGSDGSPVTDGPYRDGAPRWSPDGTTVAFHSDRSGQSEIWTVRADGTGISRVTTSPAGARFPVWAPDGRRLAFSVTGRGPFITGLSGGEAHAVSVPNDVTEVEPWSWSPDGARIAGTSRGIVVIDVSDGAFIRVSDFGEKPVWVGGSNAILFTHQNRVFVWRGAGEPIAIWSAEPNRLTSSLSVGLEGREIYFASAGSTERVWLIDFDSAVTE